MPAWLFSTLSFLIFELLASLFQNHTLQVLEHPVDGPTLAVLTNEDFQLMGMELPGMRRRLRAEIELFLEQGCPMAAEVMRQFDIRAEMITYTCICSRMFICVARAQICLEHDYV